MHHGDGYTPVVRCTLNHRHKVSGSRREESWCTGVSVAFPQKADIEQMAIDINHATTATPTDEARVGCPAHDHHRRPVRGTPRATWRIGLAHNGAEQPYRVTSDGKNSENDVKKLYPKVIVHKQWHNPLTYTQVSSKNCTQIYT